MPEEEPSILDRLYRLLDRLKRDGLVTRSIGLSPLGWVELCGDICPHARQLSDIATLRVDGIPVVRLIDPSQHPDNRIIYHDSVPADGAQVVG